MARVVRFHAFGGAEVLSLDEAEVRDPGPGEVRIAVAAFGLNRVEALFRSGAMGPVQFPSRIGYEAAGIVTAIGAGVSDWKVGDRVATLYGLSMEDFGTHAEEIVYPAEMLVPVPQSQTFEEAAASWMQCGTAWALIAAGSIAPGDVVAITAASSSVGIAAIQLANACGAFPIAVTRGREKAEALLAAGAAHVIASDEEDVATRLLDLTGGQGVRILFDALGGAPLAAMIPAVAPGGIVIAYGMLAGYTVELPLPAMMLANLTVRGFSADSIVRDAGARARMIDWLLPRLASGSLGPLIDSIYPLEAIVEAHRRLESNQQIGKIVVTI
ncbi:zinc-dependent alcohol dehydrogenase family protein [Novosphingobium aquae]|uniref:Zinc-dependent alcohol dehydrogenase family protein n=1 Tax=Novosphingobium aquae TaxID=3133435 RepID=A0ABU8S8N7_9SPHN